MPGHGTALSAGGRGPGAELKRSLAEEPNVSDPALARSAVSRGAAKVQCGPEVPQRAIARKDPATPHSREGEAKRRSRVLVARSWRVRGGFFRSLLAAR